MMKYKGKMKKRVEMMKKYASLQAPQAVGHKNSEPSSEQQRVCDVIGKFRGTPEKRHETCQKNSKEAAVKAPLIEVAAVVLMGPALTTLIPVKLS